MSDAGAPWQDYAAAPSAGPWSDYAPPPSPAADNSSGGYLKNFVAGAGESVLGAFDLLNRAVNPVSNIENYVNETGRELFGRKTDIIPQEQIPGSVAQTENVLGHVGLNPADVTANTFGEKLARGAGAGAAALLIPGDEPATVASLFRSLGTNAAIGVGATAAQEAVPSRWKPLAGLIGGIAAGSAGGAVSRIGRAATDVATPVTAAVSDTAAQRGAASVITKAAKSPQTVADILSPTNAEGQFSEAVPGSRPTSFQLTGDMGIGGLERAQAAKNPAPFNEARAAQNAARVSTITSLQPEGSASDVAASLRDQFGQFDQQTAAHAEQLLNQAQAKAEALGGTGTPEYYGQAVRQIALDADNAARARESGLWQAVDPNGDMTGNVVATRTAARDIAGNIGKTAKPMSGEEKDIFDAAQSLKSVEPVKDLIELRSRVSTEMRNQLGRDGDMRVYARLAQLRGAIENNLSDSIGDKAEEDAALAAEGKMPQAETLGARLEEWRNEWMQQRGAEARAASGAGGAAVAAGGPGGISPVLRGQGEAPGGPAGPSGIAGAPEGAPGLSKPEDFYGTPQGTASPTFDAEAQARLRAATTATRERKSTFSRGPVGQVLARAGMQDIYRLPEAMTPLKFFHPGPAGYSDMQAITKAVGEDKALPLMADFAASSLRRAAMREDGTLDPAKYMKWRNAHADALRALPPETRAAFTDAAKASNALAEANAARNTALKEAQTGALAKLMQASTPEDATAHIASLLRSRDGTGMMKAIAAKVSGDPLAVAGLRRAVAQTIEKELISNTEAATTGVNQIKSDAFQNFLKRNQGALSQVLSAREMQSLQAVAADLRRANRSIVAVKLPGGSNTTQDILAATGRQPKALSLVYRVLTDLAAATIGHHLGGEVGMLASGAASETLQAMRMVGIKRIDEVIDRALLDPKFMGELLKEYTPKTADAALGRAIRRAFIATTAQNLGYQARQRSQNQ